MKPASKRAAIATAIEKAPAKKKPPVKRAPAKKVAPRRPYLARYGEEAADLAVQYLLGCFPKDLPARQEAMRSASLKLTQYANGIDAEITALEA